MPRLSDNMVHYWGAGEHNRTSCLADVRAARTAPRSVNAGAAEGLARGITFANKELLSSIRSGAALVSGLQGSFVVYLLI